MFGEATPCYICRLHLRFKKQSLFIKSRQAQTDESLVTGSENWIKPDRIRAVLRKMHDNWSVRNYFIIG